MGANGCHRNGRIFKEETRAFFTWRTLDEDVVMIACKDSRASLKAPTESHSPNRIYVVLNRLIRPGYPIKEISKFGPDCMIEWNIHFISHDGLYPHVHYWDQGKRKENGKAYPLTDEMADIVRFVLAHTETLALSDAEALRQIDELRSRLPYKKE